MENNIRGLSQTDDSKVKVRFDGGSHTHDSNTREHYLSLRMKFPNGTTSREAKNVLSELIGKELAIEMEEDNE